MLGGEFEADLTLSAAPVRARMFAELETWLADRLPAAPGTAVPMG